MAVALKEENNSFIALKQHKCVSLTTYRKNGKPVPTPIWFAMENEKLYVMTGPGSGKVKRIRNNPKVQLTPCTQRGKLIGTTMEGVAHILPADQKGQVKAALKRKYGWMISVGNFIDKISGKKRDCCLEITPGK
jgi:PPOX class probable F420-dependent enzyme